MKLQATVQILKNALHKSARCIESRPTLSILQNVLLTRREEDGQFLLISASSDSQLTVPVQLSVVEGRFQKPMVLPISVMLSFISNLPNDCVLTFDISESSPTVDIEYCTGSGSNVTKGNVSLSYLDAKEFPLRRGITECETHISLPMSFFDNVLTNASKFVGVDDLRPVLKCLCIDVAEDLSEVAFVATNTHTLFKMIHTNNPEQGGSNFFRSGKTGQILVHSQYFKALSAFADADTIDIESGDHSVRFSSGDTELLCTYMDSRYPNYNSVIPKDNPYYICCDKKDILTAIKRISIFSSDSSRQITLKKDGMFLTVSAQNIDYALAGQDQVMITDSSCAEGFSISFSYLSLTDAVNAIPNNNLRIQLSDPTRAGVIVGDEPSPMVMALIMPLAMD